MARHVIQIKLICSGWVSPTDNSSLLQDPQKSPQAVSPKNLKL